MVAWAAVAAAESSARIALAEARRDAARDHHDDLRGIDLLERTDQRFDRAKGRVAARRYSSATCRASL